MVYGGSEAILFLNLGPSVKIRSVGTAKEILDYLLQEQQENSI